MTPTILLPQVDPRSAMMAEKPTVSKGAEEGASHFQSALEQAEASQSAAKPSEPERSGRGRAPDQEQPVSQVRESRDSKVSQASQVQTKSQTTQTSPTTQSAPTESLSSNGQATPTESLQPTGQTMPMEAALQTGSPQEPTQTVSTAQPAQTPQVTPTGQTTQVEQATQGEQATQTAEVTQPSQEFKVNKDSISSTGKPRARKKADDGWEGSLQGGGVLLDKPLAPAPTGIHPAMRSEAGVGESLLPPTVAGQSNGVHGEEGVMTPVPGVHAGRDPTLHASVPQRMAEVMTLKAGGKTETTLPIQAHSADGKSDFAFALRLVGNNASNTMENRAIPASQATLSAHSPYLGEDLAEQVARMRLISRPGGSEQMRITLHPRELGAVDMRLVVDEQRQVHLMMTADSDTAR
ncbi:MAG: hypothetical protein H7839_21950, partial [Magnetococcus sp. YQC-5]